MTPEEVASKWIYGDDLRQEILQDEIESLVLSERERCAKIVCKQCREGLNQLNGVHAVPTEIGNSMTLVSGLCDARDIWEPKDD